MRCSRPRPTSGESGRARRPSGSAPATATRIEPLPRHRARAPLHRGIDERVKPILTAGAQTVRLMLPKRLAANVRGAGARAGGLKAALESGTGAGLAQLRLYAKR